MKPRDPRSSARPRRCLPDATQVEGNGGASYLASSHRWRSEPGSCDRLDQRGLTPRRPPGLAGPFRHLTYGARHDPLERAPTRPPAGQLLLPGPGVPRRPPLHGPRRHGGPPHRPRRLSRPPERYLLEVGLMARAGRICPGYAGERCTEVLSPSITRCPTHALAYERARGSAARRGYGARHRHATRHATEGATNCTSCGEAFTPANPATGGHRRALRHGGTLAHGIEAQCRRCNYGWRRSGL